MTRLPELLLLTDRRQARYPLVETVARAVDGGARAVVLREKDLEDTARAALADQLHRLLAPVNGVLIAASIPAGPAKAVHLAAADPLPAHPLFEIVGRSCHDATEVDSAGAVDYVTVSPVFPTASKPGYGPPLALDGLSRLCQRTAIPVYALGGVTAGNAAACLEAGAAGVAVMGEVMCADDPAAAVARILDTLPPRSWKTSRHMAWRPSKIAAVDGGDR